MKILSTKQTVALVNGNPTNVENPSYLYELTSDGGVNQRHSMILSTIINDLAKKDLKLDNAVQMEGFSFHNFCLSVFGPYMTNQNGEQVYTFRNDHTLVKLDPGMKHPETNFHVKFPKGLYACVSYEREGAVRSIDYLAILNNGAIRFQYKYTPTSFRMSVLSNKELPDNVKKHLLFNKVGQQVDAQETNVEQKGNNNPAIGFKLLLDLLDEVDTNGDTTNHKD